MGRQLRYASDLLRWFTSPSRRWRIGLISAGAVLGSLLIAMELAPYLIDVEAYKPALIDAVRRTTGRDLVIDGPIRLHMFPVPGIGAGKVRFANALGAQGAQMIDVNWVSVTPSWSALLEGRIEVGTLTLYRPTIVLETDASGKPNWDFSPAARGTNQPAGAPAAGLHLAIGEVAIVRGTVRYTNPKTHKLFVVESLNASASVGSFDGPLAIAGRGTVNGVPLRLDLTVGPPTANGSMGGNEATLAVQVAAGKLDFSGTISKVSPDASIVGHVSVETGLLTDYIVDLVRATGGTAPSFSGAVIGRFSFKSDIEILPERLAVKNFTLAMGHDQAKGMLTLTPGPTPSIAGRVALNSLDLEKWQAIANDQRFADLLAPVAASVPKQAPPQLSADVTLEVARLLYRQDAIRDLSVTLQVAKGVLDVPQINATLPGGLKLHMASGGVFFLGGPRLRDTLTWLGVDSSGVPPDKLGAITVGGRVTATPGHVDLTNAAFELDGQHGTGGASVTLAMPAAATLSLDLEQLDLDAYLPKAAPTSATPQSPAAPIDSTAAASTAAPTSAPSFGLKAKVAKLLWRGETLNGAQIDGSVQGNLLKLNDVAVADLLGAKLGLRGTIQNFASDPHFDLSFNVAAPDTDRLLAYFELPKFLNGKIGAASASGGVAGTMASVVLRNVAADFLGLSGRASGKLDFTHPVAFDFSDFKLKTAEASRLATVASGHAVASIGPLAFDGTFKGSSERAIFTGNLDILGTAIMGTLDATLGARPKVVANLDVPGTLDLFKSPAGPASSSAQAGPAAPTTDGAAAERPIDLSGLRAFDATLVLRAAGVSFASFKIAAATLDATLSQGVVKIGTLSGQLFGGGATFSGTVDASKPAPAINLNGDMRGVQLSEFLRGTAGTSSFGNDDLTVAVDGQIDATGIQLACKGASPADLRKTLQGSATRSGTLSPSLTEGSRSFALLAASVGSLFSSDMAFDSLMLENFIDHKNTVSGQLTVSGSAISTEHHTVQGANATAVIAGRTDVAAATVDLTADVSSGGDRFVVTVKGPLSSPAIAAARAPAK